MGHNELLVAIKDGERLVGIPETKREHINWELVEELFVDSSGFGREGEPALTLQEFYSKVEAGFGYGVTDVGQFQVYVGVFKRK